MIKRLLIIFMIVLIAVPAVFARRKSKKAGDIDKLVYTDNMYNFSFTLLDNWDPDVQKEDAMMRLEMIQEDHKIPPELMQYPQMARTPKIQVFVSDEGEDATPQLFIDNIIDMKYKSDIKGEIMKEIAVLEENITFDGFDQSQKNLIEIDGKQAIQWVGSADYTKDLGMGETIPRSYAVCFIAIKNGKEMLTFSMICENQFMGDIFEEMKKMAESVKW